MPWISHNNPNPVQTSGVANEVEGQGKLKLIMLEELQMKDGTLPRNLWGPENRLLYLGKTFQKEYKEPYNTATIVLYLKEIKSSKLRLRNIMN